MSNNTRLKDFFENQWVRWGLIIDILIIIAVIVIVIVNSLKSSIISFNIAPIDATISVNGDSNYSNGTYQFFPGDYEITISHENLDPKTFNITLDAHSSTEIITFLSSAGDLEFYELKENYDSFIQLASIASKENNQTTDHDTSAETFITEYTKNIELYHSFLPYTDLTRDANNAISMLITLTPLADTDNSCSKYLCIESSIIGVSSPDYIKNLLVDNGFNMEYLDFSTSNP